MKTKFLFNVIVLLSMSAYGAAPMSAAHRLKHVWKPLLRHEVGSQLIQNQEIDRLKLPRVVDDSQLNELIENGELVRMPADDIEIAANLKGSRTYVRSWAKLFLEQIGRDFNKAFGSRIRVNSAIRTQEQQGRLVGYNRYAVPPEQSAHTSGIAIDLAKRNLTRKEYQWVVAYIAYMRAMGLVSAQEEPQCFHVAVMQRYGEYALEGHNEADLSVPTELPAPTVDVFQAPRFGVASWYGERFQGKLMANGVPFDRNALTVACRSYPLGTVLRITFPRTGKSVRVIVTDRGPWVKGRVLDMSEHVAQVLGLKPYGVGTVMFEPEGT